MSSPLFAALPEALQTAIRQMVDQAIAEDVGCGDLTAELVPPGQQAKASVITREPAVICGLPWMEYCFHRLAPDCMILWNYAEGDEVAANQAICEISGNARQMLTAERCALNFLQTLSATATVTRQYVKAVEGTQARIFDTRKTVPGLRLAQKYAVTVGGGCNQRLGLYDGILIKENHIAAAGSIAAVLAAAQELAGATSIQIEVESLAELQEALNAGAESVLLDNFDLHDLQAAVALNGGRAVLEASGGIDLSNVRNIALTGVDRISIGSLTKHIRAVDLSMRFKGLQ